MAFLSKFAESTSGVGLTVSLFHCFPLAMDASDDDENDLLALLEQLPGGDDVEPPQNNLELPLVCMEDGPDEPAPCEHDVGQLKTASMKGKVGSGRHGEEWEQKLLTCHMRFVKQQRNKQRVQADMASLLQDSSLRKDGQLLSLSSKVTSNGIQVILNKKSEKGNRYQRSIPWSQFVAASYGKLKKNTHIALSLGISRSMVLYMNAFVSSVYLAQQLVLLAKLVSLVSASPPLVCVRQLKWDETQLKCGVDASCSGSRVQSTWQIMAARQRLVVAWADGRSMIVRIVMPPAVLLSSGAHDIYYALKYHPFYAALNHLLDSISKQCQYRAQILESDGAYSNERLVAHLLWKDKKEEVRKSIIHLKCMNHQTQLINVCLIATIGENVLNRLYGLMVFIRNLGYWLRLRQSLYEWTLDVLNQLFSCFFLGGT